MGKNLKIIISGGGTGGHIFPAIAIANAIREKVADVEFLFVGALGRMEMEKVPAAGFSIVGLWISGLQRSLSFKNLLFPVKLLSSLLKAKKILNSFKPHAVVGTGGYASGPMLQVAAKMGIPTLIQEQNSFPGITNKLLSKKVDKICVAYDGMQKYFPNDKIILTGNPVRKDVVAIEGKRELAFNYFGFDKGKKTVLVIGGSLGARTINESIAASLAHFEENNMQLIWQTGKTYFENAKMLADKYKSNVRIYDFLNKMDLAYSAADLVVSRAGAISVSEICLVKKPSIFIPSPNVAEDHQTKNALALVNKSAALMVRDSDAKTNLFNEIKKIIDNTTLANELAENISKLAFENSADIIANEVIRLANQK